MIHSKLKKGKSSELLVQFQKDEQKFPRMISNFYNVCRDQHIRINKSPLINQNTMRFYLVTQNTENEQRNSDSGVNSDKNLKNSIQKIQLKFIVIYINEENYSIPEFDRFLEHGKQIRVILLRQTLTDDLFSLDYQIENTLSEQESLFFLCDLSAALINCLHESEIEVYDQKKDIMIRKGKEGQLSDLQIIWKNIIYQTPGLGKEKCKAIAEKYPTYQHLIKDCQKNKQLKNLLVGRGTKQIKIGSAIAQRLYKIFNSLNGKQTFY